MNCRRRLAIGTLPPAATGPGPQKSSHPYEEIREAHRPMEGETASPSSASDRGSGAGGGPARPHCTAAHKNVFFRKRIGGKMRIPIASNSLVSFQVRFAMRILI